MPQQVFNVAEGTPLQQSMGFIANSVTINNITQSWCYVSATQTFIPPYQYGVVIQLPGTDTGEIIWKTPTSLPVGPVGTGTLSATYTSDKLPPSNGVSVFTQQTTLVLGTVNAGATVNFVLPGGTQALLLVNEAGGVFVAGSVTGLTTGAVYYNNVALAIQGVIIPVSAIADASVAVRNTSIATMLVIALFTSEPEPTLAVAIAPIAGTVFTENLTQINSVPVIGAAGTLGVDIRDVGGSPSGVLNVNIADLNGSASVVGQQIMANSFPVVIASDQSSIFVKSTTTPLDENLKQVGGAAIALGSALSAASIPVVVASDDTVAENITQIKGSAPPTPFVGNVGVNGFLTVAGGLAPRTGGEVYLSVMQRPTINVFTINVNVLVAGSVLIAAPGVGLSIVLRKGRITPSAAALAADAISLGTTLTGIQLATFRIGIATAGLPQASEFTVDWDDYLIGDNLPVDISSNVATFVNTGVIITYSVVTTANWPVS